MNFFFFKRVEYTPQVMTPPIIIISPLLKFNDNKISISSLGIIDKIPSTEIISPKILLLLGSTALNALVGNEIVISKARGKWIKKKIGKINIEVIASFHPAFLMRQPAQKKMAWIDLKMIRDLKNKLKI